MGFLVVVFIVSILLVIIAFRIFYLVIKLCSADCSKLEVEGKSLRTLLCVGSGGHTTELLRLIKKLNFTKYQPRLYVAAENDVSSKAKIHKLETEICSTNYDLVLIPRSRNVDQSYSSSILSTLYATFCTIPIIYKFKPDIILCNGPGTCVPICLVAFMFRCTLLLNCRIVFVESICRVRTLSLTGKILQYFADVVVVQWPQLREKCFRAKYFGRLT